MKESLVFDIIKIELEGNFEANYEKWKRSCFSEFSFDSGTEMGVYILP